MKMATRLSVSAESGLHICDELDLNLSSSSMKPKILNFRLPIVKPEPEIVIPTSDASFADKMQWLALNRPHTARYLQDQAEAVISRHRPKPAAMLVNLTGHMEYRALNINDPAVLLAPPEDRLGRKVHDILPSALMDIFDRCVHRVHATRRSCSYTFPVRDVTFKGTVTAPSRDTIIVSVARVLCALASCEILAGVAGWA
jgi:hypothetical protein